MTTEPTNNTGHAISGPGGGDSRYNPAISSAYNDEVGRGGIPYKWLVVVAVVFGIFMSVLDATIVNIALAKLQAVFGADLCNAFQLCNKATPFGMAFYLLTPKTTYN